MLKIWKRIVSVVIVVAVAVTAAFGWAVSVAAVTIDDWAKPYTLGTKVEGPTTRFWTDNVYSFKITEKSGISVHLYSEVDITNYQLLNSYGNVVTPLKYTAVVGTANDSYIKYSTST